MPRADIPLHPSRKTLRQFALLWIACFGGLAVWEYGFRGRPTAALICGTLAVILGLTGLARPEWIRPIYVSWMVFVSPIGWTLSQVILVAIFYGLFTPIGLVFRWMGRDPLNRVIRRGHGTYWEPKPSFSDLRRYFQQF